ncbi:ferredoxin-type protein NapF [Roseibium sp.]|uniref:ferredoxin-type protein NapF n=1 Tax=Roseibium sp. TaxID=1936156 RepID=UPI003D135F17
MPQSPQFSASRRAFFRLSRQPKEDVFRPPWSDEASLAAHCTGCNACAEACPEKIISLGKDQRPFLDFNSGACTFCGACAEACPTDALDHARELDWPWKADIQKTCLSLQAVTCRTCEDVCEPRAIRFKLATGGISEPVVDEGQCTGCGACAHSCPVQAISLKKPPIQSEKVTA